MKKVPAKCCSTEEREGAYPVHFYAPKGYRPDDSVAYLMRTILNNVAGEVEAALEPTALTNAQWVPLFKLYTKVACTVAELARECRLDTGATTRMLDRPEGKGLVRRIRSTTDRRVVNLELTPQGLEAARIIPRVVCKVHNGHLRGFTEAEWEQLKSLLRRMIDNAAAGPARQARRPPHELRCGVRAARSLAAAEFSAAACRRGAVVLAWGAWHLLFSGTSETTDNAYVQGNVGVRDHAGRRHGAGRARR